MSFKGKCAKIRAAWQHGRGFRGKWALAEIFAKHGGIRGFSGPHNVLKIPVRSHGAAVLNVRDYGPDAILVSELLAEEDYVTLKSLNLQPATVCDLGANIGMASYYIRTLYPAARIFGFEPSPRERAILQKNYQDWGGGCVALPYAVGAEEHAAVRFAVHPERTGGQHLAAADDEGEWDYIDVEMRRLDGLIAAGEIPPPSLVKMDIEGAEVQALCGLGIYINTPEAYIIETHSADLHKRCLALLKDAGYSIRSDARRISDARILCMAK